MRSILFLVLALAAWGAAPPAANLAWAGDRLTNGWNWNGCYVGGHVGGLWAQSDKWIVRTPGGAFENQSLGHHSVDGPVGGFQAGCDHTFAGLVAGLQADIGWADASGQHASAKEFGVSYHSDVEWIASVTGRLGRPFNRFLPYVKGGFAWERVHYSASTIRTGTAYRANETRPGWTVGIGGEYAVSRSVSVFLEYNYYDFGTDKVRLKPQLDGLGPAFVDIKETANIVKAGLNVRF